MRRRNHIYHLSLTHCVVGLQKPIVNTASLKTVTSPRIGCHRQHKQIITLNLLWKHTDTDYDTHTHTHVDIFSASSVNKGCRASCLKENIWACVGPYEVNKKWENCINLHNSAFKFVLLKCTVYFKRWWPTNKTIGTGGVWCTVVLACQRYRAQQRATDELSSLVWLQRDSVTCGTGEENILYIWSKHIRDSELGCDGAKGESKHWH